MKQLVGFQIFTQRNMTGGQHSPLQHCKSYQSDKKIDIVRRAKDRGGNEVCPPNFNIQNLNYGILFPEERMREQNWYRVYLRILRFNKAIV